MTWDWFSLIRSTEGMHKGGFYLLFASVESERAKPVSDGYYPSLLLSPTIFRHFIYELYIPVVESSWLRDGISIWLAWSVRAVSLSMYLLLIMCEVWITYL